MDELSIHQSGGSKVVRYLSTFILAVIYVATVTFNGLAGAGVSPFLNSPGNISALHELCISPAGYTFSIWSVIYIALTFIVIYAIYQLFGNVGATPVWQLGGAISLPFMILFIINLIFNISWLFAFDRDNMLAAAIILILMVLLSNAAIVLSAMSFAKSASRLYETSKAHFWTNILVLNGYNLYDMWLILAGLINIMILVDDVNEPADQSPLCIAFLSVVLVIMIGYFIVEQFIFVKLLNPFFTHYIVYLWASVGIWMKNQDFENSAVTSLIIVNIAFASTMLVARLIILPIRNRGNMFYSDKDE